MKGKECRRFTAGGEAEGDTRGDAEGDIDEDAEDVTSAHAAVVSGKNPPALLLHEFFPSLLLSSSGVVDVRGLGLAEGVFAITDNGGSMLKILSSAGGGPYESKGSGTVCSIGSMIGSELWGLLARHCACKCGDNSRLGSEPVKYVECGPHNHANLALYDVPNFLFMLYDLLVVLGFELV